MAFARLNQSLYGGLFQLYCFPFLFFLSAYQADFYILLPKALFNVMLREFGVKGIKVQEVISLDDEMLQFLKSVSFLLFFF